MNLKPILNIFLGAILLLLSCKPEVEKSAFVLRSTGNGDELKVGLRQNNPKIEQYDLVIATPYSVAAIGLCPLGGSSDACAPGGNNFFASKLVYGTKQKKFFLINSPIKLENNFTIRTVALNKAGAEIGSLDVLFGWTGPGKGPGDGPSSSAGSTTDTGTAETNAGAQSQADSSATGTNTNSNANTSTGDDPQLLAIVRRSCDEGCHHTFADDLGNMKYTDSLQRINSGNMPKNRTWSAADRQAVIGFLGQ